MTVSSETAKSGPYTGNGVTTVFAYGFRILDASHVEVIRTVAGTASTVSPGDYTVSGVGDLAGGNVTFVVAPATGQTITIIRNAPFTQQTDLENQGAYYAETIEEALDLAAMRDQQMAEELTRVIKLPVGSDPSGLAALTEDLIRVADSADEIDVVAGIEADVTTVAGLTDDIAALPGQLSAAQAAAAAAEAALDSFDDRYLGAKSAAPSADNDGNALLVGAVYWDTVSNQMFTWSGAEWRPTFLTGNAVRTLVTATGGQTVVTVPTYIVGANTISVFLNGLKVVVGADYTETNQNTITFLSALTAGDEVEALVLQPYAIGTTGAESITTEYGITLARLLELRDGTVADLLADTTLDPAVVPVGSGIEAGGVRYEVAASSATDHHEITVGGVKLYEAGPNFTTLDRLADAVTRGNLSDGQIVSLYGTSYKVDATATGLQSALYALEIDGIRRLSDNPLNFYIFPGFKEQDLTQQYLHVSPDGRRFNRLNQLPMIRGGGDAVVGGRDCQLYWCSETGEWWMPVTAGIDLAYDFSIWSSPDLATWRLTNCYLNGTGVRGTMLPGAVTNAPQLWGPRVIKDGDKTYVIISIRTGPDYTNAFGNTAPCFRPWIAECTNVAAMTFGAPTEMPIRTSSEAMLAPDLFREDGTWYCCIKNSVLRNVEIYSGTDLVSGPWTYHVTLDLDAAGSYNSLEGQTWDLHRYYDASTGALSIKYRVHVANNRDASDKLLGVPRYFESTTSPISGYGSATRLDVSFATRNYVLNNVALEPDPRALETVKTAVTLYGGQRRDTHDAMIPLTVGTSDLYPQQDWLYYVEDAGNVANITIKEHVADRFWLACLSIYDTTGINVSGTDVGRPLAVGFANPTYHVVEMRWNEQLGKYLPTGYADKPRFRAHLSSAQTFDVETKLAFATEAYDIGGNFDTTNNRWVPGRGLVRLRAQLTITNAVAGDIYTMNIKKNGSSISNSRTHAAANGVLTVAAEYTDYPNSSDYYEIFLTPPGSRTITSTAGSTYFEGMRE